MKKILSVLLCVLLAAALASCGAKANKGEVNEIGKLVEDGYEAVMSSWDDGKWVGIYQYDNIYKKVTADFPSETEDKFNSLDMWDDDYDEQVNAIIYSLENVEITDVSDRVPSQDELDAYVGKTFGDLEQDGYSRVGSSGDSETGKYSFMYDGELYSLYVTPVDGTVITDMDDISENDIRAMTIGSVEFVGFAYGFLFE